MHVRGRGGHGLMIHIALHNGRNGGLFPARLYVQGAVQVRIVVVCVRELQTDKIPPL